jgi:cytochrome b561
MPNKVNSHYTKTALILHWITAVPMMTRGERVLTKLSHIALYAVMILLSLSGWFAFTVCSPITLGSACQSVLVSQDTNAFRLWDRISTSSTNGAARLC